MPESYVLAGNMKYYRYIIHTPFSAPGLFQMPHPNHANPMGILSPPGSRRIHSSHTGQKQSKVVHNKHCILLYHNVRKTEIYTPRVVHNNKSKPTVVSSPGEQPGTFTFTSLLCLRRSSCTTPKALSDSLGGRPLLYYIFGQNFL